ncbi:putative arginyl-tRNA--protein transferase [Candidatus Terasakiella magnetica]|uniref:Aspartate/glutamate leucyltransferase n=1 Tax=Candidatus Terasakiella magnetica TaxID=1867952 RepID=A0A1C3RCU9_9PROT|nr:arginyltransferase [Candidatus Terasakiella magnetica]SCA55106.1 putative arginyl-tRNA--protein transferase [Candidatus Terasakiella magnetica]
MRPDRAQSKVFFYTTSPLTCPYLEGQVERRIVTELSGKDANTLHNALSKGGFRRSHYMAYAPVCPNCSACIPVRVDAAHFDFSGRWRRVEKKFSKLSVEFCAPLATQEQFILFEKYQRKRHGDGDMASMDFFDYRSMVEETPVETSIIEFRDEGKLVATLLLDHLDDGLSAVYSFFDEDKKYSGMGNYMVLWAIGETVAQNLPYVYLGYLIKDCRKMSYKERYAPLEGCVDGQWVALDTD